MWYFRVFAIEFFDIGLVFSIVSMNSDSNFDLIFLFLYVTLTLTAKNDARLHNRHCDMMIQNHDRADLAPLGWIQVTMEQR
jgi:hypothetical protein